MINQGLTWLAVLAGCVVACSMAGVVADFGPWWLRVAVFVSLLTGQIVAALWAWRRLRLRAAGAAGLRPEPLTVSLTPIAVALVVSLVLMMGVDLKHSAPLVFVLGVAWAALSGRGRSKPPQGKSELGLATLVLLGVWVGAWVMNIPAASYIAHFRAGLFYASLRDVTVTAAPLAADGTPTFRVAFTAPWSMGIYSDRQWDGVSEHDTWVPYTAPVLFLPEPELGFAERQGVSGRRDLGGLLVREKITLDGVDYRGQLMHRAGRYEMMFRWLPRGGTLSRSDDYSQGPCSSIDLVAEEQRHTQELARDPRFLEPVRVSLHSLQFSPGRRFLWHRERLAKLPSGEIRTPLQAVAAPFTPYDLALARLRQQEASGTLECDPRHRMDTCLRSGEQCTAPDRSAVREAARAALLALKP